MAVAKNKKDNAARKKNTIFAPEECRPILWRQIQRHTEGKAL